MWQIINTTNWNEIRQAFAWIRDMEGVPQSPIYHAEGDVATHTKMVLDALLNMEEYQTLNEQDQQILVATALLHDVEKRSCTKTELDGRITSKGHAKKGAYTARRILYKDIKTPFEIRQAVAKLVRYHGLPLWVFEKPNPQKALLKASLEVNLKHLAIFAKADVLGRICADQKELLYKIELFEAFCQEQDCYGQAYPFKTDSARFTYFQKENSAPNYVPFETKEMMKIHLRKQQSFVFNATNIIQQLRRQWIDLFTTYGAKVKIIYLEVPYAQLMQQNSNREYVVPTKVMEKMIGKLEIPSLVEAQAVKY